MAQEPKLPPAASTTGVNSADKTHWSKLEEVEKAGRPAFLLTKTELKLLGIAGVRMSQPGPTLSSDQPLPTRLDSSLMVGSLLAAISPVFTHYSLSL